MRFLYIRFLVIFSFIGVNNHREVKKLLKNITKNRYLMFFVSFAVAFILALFLPGGQDFALYDNVIRIHVVANSNSASDQALKYKVRDEVLETAQILIKDCTNINAAEEILRQNIGVLEGAAYQTHLEEGFSYGAEAIFCEEYYPTRDYGSFRLPAGSYRSLQIKLGEAEGENWWCIIYPSFCLEASSKNNGIKIIDSESPINYRIKFKFMEILNSFFKKRPNN